MKNQSGWGRISLGTAIIIVLGVFAFSPVNASEPAAEDTWQFNLMLYGWLPSIDGTLKYETPGAGGGPGVDASTLIDDIQSVFMGAAEARKNKWSIFGDAIYLDMADEKNDSVHVGLGIGSGLNIDVGARAELTGWLTHLSGAYNVVHADRGQLDILLGFRYLSLDTEIDLKISGPLPPTLPTKKLTRSTDVLDGVIGVRGNVALVGDLYLPYHLDVGTGGSEFSWQAMAGLGYRFNWGGLFLEYRYINFDQKDDKLFDNFSMAGPAVGVMVSF